KEGSSERVEFAIKLPGRDPESNKVVWLPIDAKFPMEDYQRLVEAQEKADVTAADAAARQLEARLKASAKDIAEKYLNPPATTDFGIMFLPAEGLYAEALRRPGLVESLQHNYRVVVAGPTTIAALLNSLQMGFRTLAIEKRSSEVWKLLGAVKTEFEKFGTILDRVHKQLAVASNTIEDASRKTRTIQRRLREVEALPVAESVELLPLEEDYESEEEPGQ
ncbi:MAG TPA: DNA recombination protein RmuC, partial [Planctomycetota bacterium]|nr:DNA recombination protein RmuC [Planctomycetota bacterium]